MATATTCEPNRTKAYSEDLRWRMVWQVLVEGFKYSQVAQHLNVDVATVWRIVELFNTTGTVEPKKYPESRLYTKLTRPLELLILHTVLDQPGIYLKDIKKKIYLTTGADISLSCICRFLHKVGFTRQKLKVAAMERDEKLRSEFIADVSVYDRDMLIFLDEVGSDKRETLRKYGYSLRGKPITATKSASRGKRVSTIAIMSTRGLLDCMSTTGTVDSYVFCDFVEKFLLPHLMPFNGINPHSVVVLDNCSIHHCETVTRMINQVGALVHFLPPYSPDFNPIENLFSKVKFTMKEYENFAQILDHETITHLAFASISPGDCQQWIKNAKIYS